MYLAFWDVVFVCVGNDVCEDGVYVWWWLSEKATSVSVVNCFVVVCIWCVC